MFFFRNHGVTLKELILSVLLLRNKNGNSFVKHAISGFKPSENKLSVWPMLYQKGEIIYKTLFIINSFMRFLLYPLHKHPLISGILSLNISFYAFPEIKTPIVSFLLKHQSFSPDKLIQISKFSIK
ncbi:hypothetical protein H311_02043 [Anncaliia algerae PRA109]|nr:hypothetical protein H311_02043 [Anncaliia algerae PRA109]